MEHSRSKKPFTDSEMEDNFGSITKQLSVPKKPYLLSSSSSSSSSKPPLGPVPLLLKKPNNSSSLPATIEAVTANNSEQDKNQQRQTHDDESSAHKINNVTLDIDAADHHHDEALNLETKNQHELTKVFDPSADARKLKRVISNRMSAHRSRMRKLEHVANLERQCGQLEKQISVLQPQVEEFANLKHMLMLEQTVLTQRVEALENQRSVKQGEIERNQAEVHRLREIEKRQKEAEAQAMMAFANWDTLPNNQQILLHTTINPAQGFQSIGGTSGMEVDDEQTLKLMNSGASTNELDAIVNPPKLSDNNNKATSSDQLRFYF